MEQWGTASLLRPCNGSAYLIFSPASCKVAALQASSILALAMLRRKSEPVIPNITGAPVFLGTFGPCQHLVMLGRQFIDEAPLGREPC